ncbi:MAG: hypothetical protein ACTHL3_05785 [Candidatus Nitrosocosmicus sp.]
MKGTILYTVSVAFEAIETYLQILPISFSISTDDSKTNVVMAGLWITID